MSGSLVWKGVVAIERPDPSRTKADEPLQCRVMSARTQVNGMRAIAARLPYAMLVDKFRAEDGDSVYHYAELHAGHLQIMDRATQKEFFLHPEAINHQLSSPAH